jgi:hypothetical protein
MACKKKLYECRPRPAGVWEIETQPTRRHTRKQSCDPASLERGVRQWLADKVQGNLLGLWLLVAEHLRLGTWDLLCGWTGQPPERVEPRLALQLVHEAVLCTSGFRCDRSLTQGGGFELANGLPFLASDTAVHELLAQHTIEDALRLQVALGKIRRASGHFRGQLLAVDPHRVRSYSQRHMRRHASPKASQPAKVAQTFWVLDADTHQPICFTTATASRTVAEATPPLLDLAACILDPQPRQALVVADAEHCSAELADEVHRRTGFDLLVPMPNQPALTRQVQAIAPEQFRPRWAGYATTQRPYPMRRSHRGPYYQFVQHSGERPQDWHFKAFLCTTDREEVDALTLDFPRRWHVEEFFNANQALGWKRAGTANLHIRYGQMTLALLAQAAIHQLRTRLGEPVCGWDANHLAKDFFRGLDGDVRVQEDTVIVTYYNAPNASQWRQHYENLPHKLREENINPQVPWLYGFKLDFRFR